MSTSVSQHLTRRHLTTSSGRPQLEVKSAEGSGVVWLDLAVADASITAAALRAELEPLMSLDEPSVTQDDIASTVEDLLASDEWPEVSRYGQIRKLSATFLIPTPATLARSHDDSSQAKADSPILFATRLELALSAGWIISVWHPVFQLTQSTVRHEPPAEALHRVRDTNALTVSELV